MILFDFMTQSLVHENISSIAQNFTPEEAQAICNIPLGLSTRSDGWYCCLEENGYFSVKSAYNIARRLRYGHLIAARGPAEDQNVFMEGL